eukprot:scaffold189_cov118-Isochrysis_galbana.AAC.2
MEAGLDPVPVLVLPGGHFAAEHLRQLETARGSAAPGDAGGGRHGRRPARVAVTPGRLAARGRRRSHREPRGPAACGRRRRGTWRMRGRRARRPQ